MCLKSLKKWNNWAAWGTDLEARRLIEQNCWENSRLILWRCHSSQAVPGVDQVSSCAEKSEMVSIDMVPQAKFQKSVMFFMGKQMVLESPILGIAPIFSVSKAKVRVTSRIFTRSKQNFST